MHSLSAGKLNRCRKLNLHRFDERLMLQGLKAQAVRTRGFFAQALTLVGFVLVVVAVKEHHLTVAFKGKNVRGNTVKEPAVVRRQGVGALVHRPRAHPRAFAGRRP